MYSFDGTKIRKGKEFRRIVWNTKFEIIESLSQDKATCNLKQLDCLVLILENRNGLFSHQAIDACRGRCYRQLYPWKLYGSWFYTDNVRYNWCSFVRRRIKRIGKLLTCYSPQRELYVGKRSHREKMSDLTTPLTVNNKVPSKVPWMCWNSPNSPNQMFFLCLALEYCKKNFF